MRAITQRPLFLLALAALATTAGYAAKPAAKPSQPKTPSVGAATAAEQGAFFEDVNVEVVNVEVYVTDKNGASIKGLAKDDFQIFEDGRPVQISNFLAVDESTRRARMPTLTLPPIPGRETQPVEIPEIPEEQRLYMIVYIDNFNMHPFNRNRAFRSLREFLDKNIGPDDRVMLVTYNRSFKERVAFTSDVSQVTRELLKDSPLEKEAGYGTHIESDRNDALKLIEDSDSAQQAAGQVRAYAGSVNNDAIFSIDAIKGLVDKLGGLPGRKALVYVSEGLPMRAGEDLFQALNEKFRQSSYLLEAQEFDLSRRYQELAAQANSNRVTFYTIDAGGLRTLSSSSAERQTAGQPGMSTFIDTQNIYNLQAPLQTLAEETGGKAILNTNDAGPALATVGTDLRTYYSLGYQPSHAGDGRYHRIEVKVKGGKDRTLRVRHRAGYRDKPIEQRMSDATMASLLFGDLGNPIGASLTFGTPMHTDSGNAQVPIHLRIPLDKVTTIPQADTQEAHLRAFIGVLDDEGNLSDVQVAPITIQVPTADWDNAKTKGWGYDITLVMRTGPQKVAIGLRDDLGGTSSYVSGGIVVR